MHPTLSWVVNKQPLLSLSNQESIHVHQEDGIKWKIQQEEIQS